VKNVHRFHDKTDHAVCILVSTDPALGNFIPGRI